MASSVLEAGPSAFPASITPVALPMRSLMLKVAGLALVGLAATSCGDASPTAVATPQVGEPTALLGTLLGAPRDVHVMERQVPLAAAITASRTVGLFGGTIAIPEAGISVYVPVGAVLRSTKITVTAPAGRAVAYEFSPHGTQFLVPLIVTQDLDRVALNGVAPSSLFAAYFENLPDIDTGTLIAPVTELLNIVLAGTDKIRFPVGHFSGYLVAGGFAGPREADY